MYLGQDVRSLKECLRSCYGDNMTSGQVLCCRQYLQRDIELVMLAGKNDHLFLSFPCRLK